MRGAEYDTDCATCRNSSSIGSISGEWNACDTRSRFVLRPSPASIASTVDTTSSAPEITVEVGPFTAAIDTDSS